MATEPLDLQAIAELHQAMDEQSNHPRLGTSGEQLGFYLSTRRASIRSTSNKPKHPEGKQHTSASKRPLIAMAAGGVWIRRDGSDRLGVGAPHSTPRSTRSARREMAIA